MVNIQDPNPDALYIGNPTISAMEGIFDPPSLEYRSPMKRLDAYLSDYLGINEKGRYIYTHDLFILNATFLMKKYPLLTSALMVVLHDNLPSCPSVATKEQLENLIPLPDGNYVPCTNLEAISNALIIKDNLVKSVKLPPVDYSKSNFPAGFVDDMRRLQAQYDIALGVIDAVLDVICQHDSLVSEPSSYRYKISAAVKLMNDLSINPEIDLSYLYR